MANLIDLLPSGRRPRAAAAAVLVAVALTALVAVLAAQATAATKAAGISAYPSAATIPATGALPAGGAPGIQLAAAIGEQEAAQIVVSGAKTVAATIDAAGLGGVQARLAFAHFVSFGSRQVPDALLP